MAAHPPAAPTQAPPRSRRPRKRQPRPGRRRTESPRRPRWRRLHQPRPRRPRRVAAAPVRDAATRRRPPARQRAPGVADSDRSQSQDGPLASGPKSSCTAVVAGRGLRGASQIGSGTGARFPSVLRGSLLLRASHRTHVRHVAGQASWVGPNAVLSPLWTQASEGGNHRTAEPMDSVLGRVGQVPIGLLDHVSTRQSARYAMLLVCRNSGLRRPPWLA